MSGLCPIVKYVVFAAIEDHFRNIRILATARRRQRDAINRAGRRTTMTKRKGFPKGLVDKFARFVAWSAQVDTVNEQSSPDSKPHHISALNITPHQDAAHHAYFGGRIELVKQGYVKNLVLHRYDIASAYPSAVQSTSCCGARRAHSASR